MGNGQKMRGGNVEKISAAVVIVLGAAIVGFSPSRWDPVILGLPRGHGLHADDVVGMVFVLLGIAALWRTS